MQVLTQQVFLYDSETTHVKLSSSDNHIYASCKKLSLLIFLMKKFKFIFIFDVLLSTYFDLFNSLLVYGIRLWSNFSLTFKTSCHKKKSHNRPIVGLSDRESCRGIVFPNFELWTLPSSYVYSNLIYVKKNLSLFFNDSSRYRNGKYLVSPYQKSHQSHSFQQLALLNKLPGFKQSD